MSPSPRSKEQDGHPNAKRRFEEALIRNGSIRNSKKWRCPHPSHPDQHPSLTFDYDQTGSYIRFKCWSGKGCTDTKEGREAILKELGLSWPDLYDKPLELTGSTKGSGVKVTSTTRYIYRDVSGEEVAVKTRYDKSDRSKTFRWDQPDGSPLPKGFRPPLYRVNDLVASKSDGRAVWLVEGERCVDDLVRQGITATTTPGGAAANWRDADTEYFRNLDVTISIDNDVPGYRYGLKALKALEPVANSVRVVKAAVPDEKADISDHLAARKPVDEMVLVTAAELKEGAGANQLHDGIGSDDDNPAQPVERYGLKPVDWPTFWANEPADMDWLIEPVVPVGRQVTIFAPAKMGKSLLSLDIAAAAASGRPILGGNALKEPISVIYVDMEMTEADLRERLEDFGYGPADDLSQLHYYSLPALPPLDSDEGGEVLQGLARLHGSQLVVIDTLARVVTGDENVADTYRDFYRHVISIVAKEREWLLDSVANT